MSRAIGHINLWEKLTGKRSAGNPHAAFDEAGTGDGRKPTHQPSTLRASRKGWHVQWELVPPG